MKKLFLIFLISISSAHANELIYLSCKGIVGGSEHNSDSKPVINDFIINKQAKTIEIIINGIPEGSDSNLIHKYNETATQYITKNGKIAFNRHTLVYEYRGMMFRISGQCKVKKSSI